MDSLSRELALRIGLAARALPDTDSARLLDVLSDCVSYPFSPEKFAALTVKDLKTAHDGELAELPQAALKNALRVLKGEEGENLPELPAIEGYHDGDLPGSVRVAFASNNGLDLDGHFGSCSYFLIYQLNADEYRLIDIRQPPANPTDKNAARTALVADCQVLYVASIGGPPAASVIKAGVHPLKKPDGGNINALCAQLQTQLASAPPPWLAKIMGVPSRLRFTEEDAA
jgi:nitrogen fixation protein NifX